MQEALTELVGLLEPVGKPDLHQLFLDWDGARRLAEQGFVLDEYVAGQWADLADAPGFPHGKPGYPGLMTVDSFDQLARIVFFKTPGDKVRLTIERDGQTLEVTAILAGLQ